MTSSKEVGLTTYHLPPTTYHLQAGREETSDSFPPLIFFSVELGKESAPIRLSEVKREL